MQPFSQFLSEVGFNIARTQMPQIDDHHDFVDYLERCGCEVLRIESMVAMIQCTQQDFDQSKVDNIKNSTVGKPIIISDDYFILDGHHRFIAAKQSGEKLIDSYYVNTSINKLLKYANDYLGVNDG